ncbi:hypothetical protein HL653_12350 [Sphingomonas sp. AP4-R1]|uniref:hypothetical protein n=1 Tax=Sphingomonas sp. AP4-R1 TaxID=2735134 RepID=UPI0014937E47|nr:hypothetical protein [Sphingomonas sp. AP4-R1]QJU58454.1 hypothetical protein HL653_12350 [Sphingomonas sp. AP4-R1]
MRRTLANGVPTAIFCVGIATDEKTCRFARDDCETTEQALAIFRRYGSLDHGYCQAPPPPGCDSSPATPSPLPLLADLFGAIHRPAVIMPDIVAQIDQVAMRRDRVLIAMLARPGPREH